MALGRTIVILGLVFIVVGLAAIAAARFNLPVGRLPGDLSWRGRNWQISFPLATSLLVSIVLSLLLYIVDRVRR